MRKLLGLLLLLFPCVCLASSGVQPIGGVTATAVASYANIWVDSSDNLWVDSSGNAWVTTGTQRNIWVDSSDNYWKDSSANFWETP